MENNKPARKILLIDDDADDRKYFIEAVQEIDNTIQCVTAKDGDQALQLLRDPQNSLPDYIFLDLRMPKINGRQCLIQLKSDDRLKAIPVTVYTTSRELKESEELQGLGAVRFITKPANTEEIFYVVSQTLEEQDF
ncbi:MAG TPA: response regulator [Chitinophagaceae bacterium]|jgi:CheY-like chemotaxis protein|nr:response regulator [Chitinophagaceae bacterium]